ncbi:hypothetical protein HaLaN_16992, partial [Haematococcus lacustris]
MMEHQEDPFSMLTATASAKEQQQEGVQGGGSGVGCSGLLPGLGVAVHPGLVRPGWPPGLLPQPPSEVLGFTADTVVARQLLGPPPMLYHVPASQALLARPLLVKLDASCQQPPSSPHCTAVLLGVSLQLAPGLDIQALS